MSPRRWPELGERPHPISSTTRQYQRPVGEKRWDWMASSGVEGGGERRQNERLNLISLPLKMSHQTADYCTTSRTVGSDNGNKCLKSQRNWTERLLSPTNDEKQWPWANMTMEWACSDGRREQERQMSLQRGRQTCGWRKLVVEKDEGGWPACWHHLPASPPAAMLVVGWWGGWEADWRALAARWRCDAPPQGLGSTAQNAPPVLSLKPGCWQLSEHHSPPCPVLVAVVQIFRVRKEGERRGRRGTRSLKTPRPRRMGEWHQQQASCSKSNTRLKIAKKGQWAFGKLHKALNCYHEQREPARHIKMGH